MCDSGISPLFIDLAGEDRSHNHGIMLSAPWNGVWFDIMGQNAKPKAHTPVKISWFKDKLNKIAYITLPNAKGEVRGIDQLFGDNTYGPDGKFAKNGFAAVAKYDHNKDGRIDEDDSIYEKLRLWIDYNNDGKADPSELMGTLREYEIEMIDLHYDHNYLEKDKYGNEIKYKSVALRKSYNPEDKQRFFMVFDIWFESSHMKAMLTEMLHQQGK
ncbi:MAG: hypothetical protein ACK41T_06785 [Pseudobdellovibrio sp.]